MKNKILLNFFLLLTFASATAFAKVQYQNTKKMIDENNWNLVVAKRNSLQPEIREQVEKSIQKIKDSKTNLVLVHKAAEDLAKDKKEVKAEINENAKVKTNANLKYKPIYIIVQGVTLGEEIWWGPFGKLIETDQNFYFYKYNKRTFWNTNVKRLKENILQVLQENPQQEVRVVGYSAGGPMALLALDSLQQDENNLGYVEELSRLKVFSVAAPILGYGIPQEFISRIIGGTIFGYTAVEVGLGVRGKFSSKKLNNCEQFITTNPELDFHARFHRGVYPQEADLCGAENIHLLNDKTHYTAPQYVIEQLIQRPVAETVLY